MVYWSDWSTGLSGLDGLLVYWSTGLDGLLVYWSGLEWLVGERWSEGRMIGLECYDCHWFDCFRYFMNELMALMILWVWVRRSFAVSGEIRFWSSAM